ncbi:MAG TPA: STAS/SEC14 domain-containing protein [Acidimicrobiales bacterium]|nr:STAS/SEC14 domain-containing protein [Acidimicrobiales bacterium]
MLEKLSDLPDGVLGFRASGELTADDYRTVLVPAVEAALGTRDKLRLLYILGEDLEGLSAGAAWQDTKVGIGHVTRWEKVAVVSDKDWLRHSVDVFGYLIPGEIKAFLPSEEADARAWVVS